MKGPCHGLFTYFTSTGECGDLSRGYALMMQVDIKGLPKGGWSKIALNN
jgi:hypothetical protein